MTVAHDRATLRGIAELILEARRDLVELGITLLGSEDHPSRVVFHFSSDEGHHSIAIERDDWAELPAEILAHDASRRVVAEWRRRQLLAAQMPWQSNNESFRASRFDAA